MSTEWGTFPPRGWEAKADEEAAFEPANAHLYSEASGAERQWFQTSRKLTVVEEYAERLEREYNALEQEHRNLARQVRLGELREAATYHVAHRRLPCSNWFSLALLLSACDDRLDDMHILLSEAGENVNPTTWAEDAPSPLACACMNVNDTLFGIFEYAPEYDTERTKVNFSKNQYALVSAIVAAGATVNSVSAFGSTALSLLDYISTKDEKIFKLLLENGADPNIFRPGLQSPPLLHCVGLGHVSCLRMMIQNGANLSVRGQWEGPDDTALHVLLGDEYHRDERTSNEMLRILLQAGAPIEARTIDGDTPLLLACWRDDETKARILLEAGADANVASSEGEPAVLIAARLGHLGFFKLLIDRGAQRPILSRARLNELLKPPAKFVWLHYIPHQRGFF